MKVGQDEDGTIQQSCVLGTPHLQTHLRPRYMEHTPTHSQELSQFLIYSMRLWIALAFRFTASADFKT